MDDFIKFLLVTGQIDEVFFGKKKEEEETMILKRTLDKESDNKKDNSDK